jgi:hypothetical protein
MSVQKACSFLRAEYIERVIDADLKIAYPDFGIGIPLLERCKG